MNGTTEQHPSSELLTSLALGRFDDDRLAKIEDHVATCAVCAQVLAQAPEDAFVSLIHSAQSLSDTALPATQCATLATPLPAARSDSTAVWLCSGGSAAAELPLLPAEHPRYRPVRVLGQGGMGAVWLAEHKLMGRQVAVKVIRREILAKPGAAERFRNEVHSAARLHHPNIVTAFDADETADTPLLVMEYVDGVSLADDVRRRGPLPIAEACDAVRQVAVGLQHAHEKGLVHRDLKPQNLMRTPDGVVKILDFGLAVLHDVGPQPLPSGESAPTAGGLTGVNVVVGTPDYIAPEQAEDSHKADIKSDIYSLGCTLYHLLTGRVPFPDESIVRKLDGHRTQDPWPIRSLRPEVPEDVAAVVTKMMAKHPGDRYQSAAAVADALAPFTRDALPQRPRRVARYALVTLLALAVGLVGWLNGPAIYRFSTNQGLLTIETTDDDVEVRVKQGGEEVKLIDNKTGREITLKAGTYQLEITKGREGLTLSAKEFTLHRGSREIVCVSFDPKATDRAAVQAALRELAGTWSLISYQADGAKLIGLHKGRNQKFTGDRLESTIDGAFGLFSTVKVVDPISVPRKVDLVDWKGIAIERTSAIYKIEGDTLHWCQSVDNAPRPTAFDTSKGSGVYYSIWKRVQQAKVGEVRQFFGHLDGVTQVAFSPDGRQALSGGGWPDATDNTIRLWEVATGKELLCLR